MLCLEVTESGVMDDPRRAQTMLRKLRGAGRRGLDRRLRHGLLVARLHQQLPVSELKIDRSFVGGMAADEDDAAIVRSTIEIGHNLGLRVVAEGVEERHRAAPARDGLHLGQGYYFAEPMDASGFLRWAMARAAGADVAQVQ